LSYCSFSTIAEARDCFCQFRMEVLGKPVIRKWSTAPRLYVEAVLPSCLLQSCFENFLGFHPQVGSITLLLLERVLLTLLAKIERFSETTKEMDRKIKATKIKNPPHFKAHTGQVRCDLNLLFTACCQTSQGVCHPEPVVFKPNFNK
ncbi:MAG: hypothetical protein J5932_04990, partial [Prevotella sp.]|nr:hypothetical protein [Prevotella sp.]